MHKDSEEKTATELTREAAELRRKIEEEAKKSEELMRSIAKSQFCVDQMFRFFAPGVNTEEEKRELIEIISLNPPEIFLDRLPLLPIALLLSNGRLSGTQRIHAAGNRKVDDGAVIFLASVLRFAPQASQVIALDISRTAVTAHGLFYVVEMMVEKCRKFTLDARGLVDAFVDPNGTLATAANTSTSNKRTSSPSEDPFLPRLVSMLKAAEKKSYCTIYL